MKFREVIVKPQQFRFIDRQHRPFYSSVTLYADIFRIAVFQRILVGFIIQDTGEHHRLIFCVNLFEGTGRHRLRFLDIRAGSRFAACHSGKVKRKLVILFAAFSKQVPAGRFQRVPLGLLFLFLPGTGRSGGRSLRFFLGNFFNLYLRQIKQCHLPVGWLGGEWFLQFRRRRNGRFYTRRFFLLL